MTNPTSESAKPVGWFRKTFFGTYVQMSGQQMDSFPLYAAPIAQTSDARDAARWRVLVNMQANGDEWLPLGVAVDRVDAAIAAIQRGKE